MAHRGDDDESSSCRYDAAWMLHGCRMDTVRRGGPEMSHRETGGERGAITTDIYIYKKGAE